MRMLQNLFYYGQLASKAAATKIVAITPATKSTLQGIGLDIVNGCKGIKAEKADEDMTPATKAMFDEWEPLHHAENLTPGQQMRYDELTDALTDIAADGEPEETEESSS